MLICPDCWVTVRQKLVPFQETYYILMFYITGDPVFIKLKPYNSFLIDQLCIGIISTNASMGKQKDSFKEYLHSHGMDQKTFDQIVQGQFTSRPFLPLARPSFKGRVSRLRSKDETSGCDEIEVEADLGDGESLKVIVGREAIFIYGHWMAKADLAYVFETKGKI